MAGRSPGGRQGGAAAGQLTLTRSVNGSAFLILKTYQLFAAAVKDGRSLKWGTFRYPWVTLKLLLILSVMLVGGLFIGPAQALILERGGHACDQLIAAAAYDVIALALATGLSVFKPGARFRRETIFTSDA